MGRQKGFTLIELLVVISIIAVLMSILMPALNKAKAAVRDAICKSNLHQWGILWKMITDDNNGFFFDRDVMLHWQEEIVQHYDTSVHPKMWLCPNATRTEAEGGRNPYKAWDDWILGVYVKSSYGVNLWIANGNITGAGGSADFDKNCWRTPSMRGAAFGPIFIDSIKWDMQPNEEDQPLPYETAPWVAGPANEMKRCCVKRHVKYFVNMVTMDLSAKRRTVKELWRVRWHRNWDMTATLPVWPEWMADIPEPAW